jgi:hypothetical protein
MLLHAAHFIPKVLSKFAKSEERKFQDLMLLEKVAFTYLSTCRIGAVIAIADWPIEQESRAEGEGGLRPHRPGLLPNAKFVIIFDDLEVSFTRRISTVLCTSLRD